jgi:hypothetical protein
MNWNAIEVTCNINHRYRLFGSFPKPLLVEFRKIEIPGYSSTGVAMDHGMSSEPLSRELHVYSENKRAWLLAHANEFVVICEDRIQGFHPDYESAFNAGLKAFGLGRRFLIKEICETEPVYVVY